MTDDQFDARGPVRGPAPVDSPRPSDAAAAAEPDDDVVLGATRVTLVPRAAPAEPDQPVSTAVESREMTSTATAAQRPAVASRARWTPSFGWLGLLPFFVYVSVLFLVPVVILLLTAFQSEDTGALTGANVAASLRGAYLDGLGHSVEVSAIDAVLAAILGLVLAQALVTSRSAMLQRLVASASAVLTNFGGLPLAFLFVAAIGNAGVLSSFLDDHLHFSLQNDLHLDLYGFSGVEFVYLYFLVPLMVLVITPSLAGLRPQWQEAASNLGATRAQYWRYVAGPVLLPSFAGAVALLFCSSISAYATAAALTNGTLSLTPLQIASVLGGNVLAGQQNVGAALALDLMIVIIPLTMIYLAMQRRTSRWLR